jgi:cytoskeletal protein RodZ
MTTAKQRPPRPRPWEQGGETVSFGTWLRRQREVRQIVLRDIADSTNISIRYLEALEHDRFDALPAAVFAKGFLREYARYVGLDPDEVVNNFLAAQQAGGEGADAPPEAPSPRRVRDWSHGLALLLVVLGLLGAVAALAFYAERRRGASRPPPAISAPPPAVPAGAAPRPPAAQAALRVVLDFTEDSWVEALTDGQRRLSELHVQGESLQLDAQESVVLSLGNAKGVRVEVNGRPFTLPATEGEIRDLRIGLESLDAGAAKEPG